MTLSTFFSILVTGLVLSQVWSLLWFFIQSVLYGSHLILNVTVDLFTHRAGDYQDAMLEREQLNALVDERGAAKAVFVNRTHLAPQPGA